MPDSQRELRSRQWFRGPEYYNFARRTYIRSEGFNSDVFENFKTSTTCHLANIAMRLRRKIHWDASAQQVTGDEEANAFQLREQRKGFEVV